MMFLRVLYMHVYNYVYKLIQRFCPRIDAKPRIVKHLQMTCCMSRYLRKGPKKGRVGREGEQGCGWGRYKRLQRVKRKLTLSRGFCMHGPGDLPSPVYTRMHEEVHGVHIT